jgi:signal transduction histidine kinase
MGSLIDLLAEQSISASIWVKVPKGEAWQRDLDRYLESPVLTSQVYWFRNQREEPTEEVPGESSKFRLNSPVLAPSGVATASPSTSVVLPIESPLRREYFLLVWSAKFCAVLVAQRTKTTGTLAEGEAEEGSEKRQSLTAYLSFNAETVRHAIDVLQSLSSEVPRESIPEIQAINPAWIDRLLAKHIQRQEELWQRASSHRRQAEMANLLQLQNEDLMSSLRLRDEFLNNVGQELRTPLTNMKTALTLLNSPTLKPTQRQRYMDLLVKECDRQNSLITSLLDLVSLDQMGEVTLQPLFLIEVVPGVVSTYQPLAEEKGVRLAYTVPESLPAIACLNAWLRQIVINLLHNGIKFTPRGGQVWVRAKQQGDYVQLEFKDTGVGIPTSEISKIFERFYRVRQASDDETGGAGLGLTIVQKLLLRCSGSISVTSRLGEGTSFNVLLPIYPKNDEKTGG